MTACLDAVRAGKPACETKGVVDYPILNFDPCDVVPAFLHIITGVFNKIFDYSKEKLVKLLDEPFMQRSPEARYMSGRISELDEKQKREVGKLEQLQNEVQQLQCNLAHLQSYLKKLQA